MSLLPANVNSEAAKQRRLPAGAHPGDTSEGASLHVTPEGANVYSVLNYFFLISFLCDFAENPNFAENPTD